jgi:hypothetical protein
LVAYSLNRGSFSVPVTWSALYFLSAVGLCMENAGSDNAATNAANGCLSLIVASVALPAVHES